MIRVCSRPRWMASLLAVALLLSCCPRGAWAWGPLGHRIIARLAEQQLDPVALAQVRELLALDHARYLSQVANWADDLRETDPALFRRTRRLHFVNFHSADCIYVPARDCRHGECAIAAINGYSAILADRANAPRVRAQALAFLVHFVGDVHQPLHAGHGPGAGGNDFQVRWEGRGSNLHRVWDSLMLDSMHLPAAGYADKLSAQRTPIESGGTPVDWAQESCRIDRDDGVYPSSHRIDRAYVERELPIAERRLRQAAARLAALLDRDLSGPPRG